MSATDVNGPSGEPVGSHWRRDPAAATAGEQAPRGRTGFEPAAGEQISGGRARGDQAASGHAASAPEPPEPIHLSGPGSGRRRAVLAGGVVAAAAVGIGAVVWRGGDSGSPTAADTPSSTATAEVTARDLEEYQRLTAEGKLGEAGQRMEALKEKLNRLNRR